MLDETGARIALASLAILIMIGPDYWVRFKKRRVQKLAHERHKHLEYVEAGGIIDFYIGDAIKDTPDKIKLLRRRSILEDFEKACPEGVTDNSYNGDLLEHWIRETAIKLFLTHRGELMSPATDE